MSEINILRDAAIDPMLKGIVLGFHDALCSRDAPSALQQSIKELAGPLFTEYGKR